MKQEHVAGYFISTVFLGLDHGFGGTPLWFETMVFKQRSSQDCWRYGTWEEAEVGHARVVTMAANASFMMRSRARWRAGKRAYIMAWQGLERYAVQLPFCAAALPIVEFVRAFRREPSLMDLVELMDIG